MPRSGFSGWRHEQYSGSEDAGGVTCLAAVRYLGHEEG